MNQKLLEGEENIKLNNHVFPPIFYFFLHLVLFFLLVVLSFQSFVLEPYLRPSLLLPIFESPHTKKKKKEEEEEKKKRKKIVGRKQKIYSSEKRTQERPKNGPRLVEKV